MNFAERVLSFYKNLDIPKDLPKGIGVLYPFGDDKVLSINQKFYTKYYNDYKERTFLIGINPGRLGAGITGIPFTDPMRLESILEIENDFDKKPELSSRFIFDVIEAFGGPELFYSSFYFSSVSPLGFVKEGKNINYYDQKDLEESLENYIHEKLLQQIELLPSNRDFAFSLGMGKNQKYLEKINKKHNYFNEIIPLPHPRWVMQYRLKRKNEFVHQYIQELERVFI